MAEMSFEQRAEAINRINHSTQYVFDMANGGLRFRVEAAEAINKTLQTQLSWYKSRDNKWEFKLVTFLSKLLRRAK